MGKREFEKTVLMTVDTEDGVWNYAIELIRSMQDHGVKFGLATMGKGLSADQKDEINALGNVELFESNYKTEWMEQAWEDVKTTGEWLLEIERQLNPDLVHLNHYCYGQLKFNTPVLIVGHWCMYSWWQAVKGELPPPEWETYQAKVKRGLEKADFIVSPTYSMLSSLQKYYGHLAKSKVILNGRDKSLFNENPKKDIIISVGSLKDEAKNLTLLEQIAGELSWPSYIAGENTSPDTGYNYLQSNTISLGKLSRKEEVELMTHSAIFVLPALYEPFGLSVLEAAMSGCALILGNIPSLREIWGDAAVYVDPRDADDLCRSIQMFIDDEEMRCEYVQKAQMKAIAYTSDKMAKEYLELYRFLDEKIHA